MWFKAILVAGSLAIGAAGMATYDRRPAEPKWPLVPISLQADRDAWLAKAAAAESARKGWEDRAKASEKRLAERNDAATDAVTTESTACDARGASSFRSGYDQGVSVGRRQCKNNAQTSGRAAVRPVPGGVRDDISTGFNAGAYRP